MSVETKTIELDLDKEKELEQLIAAIRKKKIKVGQEEFYLKLFISYSMTDTIYASFLLMLTKYFSKIIEESRKDYKADFIYHYKAADEIFWFYFKSFDTNKLENQIEKEFNLKIEREKKNPLDEVFGIWKDEDISLEKIREKAWQRNN